MEAGFTDPILTEIEASLRILGMTARDFGLLCLRDPSLVADLRLGRECRSRTRDRIRAFILKHSTNPASSPEE